MDKRRILETKIDKTYEQLSSFTFDDIHGRLKELKQELWDDDYTIMVIGEFNSGKSTFINALLKQGILPTGITPTTATINACSYGETESIEIRLKDGTNKSLAHNRDVLEKYIAKNNEDVSDIDFIKVTSKVELLKDNIILIDTPGLNDANSVRSDITYQMLPRADVIFFVIHITNSFRRTEYEFIKDVMLKEGMDRIIFVANFIDEIEEDEIEAKIKSLQHFIQKKLNIKDPQIIELSAIEAIEGYESKDDSLIELSNITTVENKMYELCYSGSRIIDKLKRYYTRYYFILEKYAEQLNVLQELGNKDLNELSLTLESINQWSEKETAYFQEITEYINQYQLEYNEIIIKSIDYQFNKICSNVSDLISSYNGVDFITYMENTIPNKVKIELKNWIERYAGQIHLLIKKLEHGLATGLTNTFEQEILLKPNYKHIEEQSEQINLSFEKAMNTNISSGLLVGGASAVLLTVGAPVLIPIIGMAGMPYIRDVMHKNQMEKFKPQINEQAIHAIREHQQIFTTNILDYVNKNIAIIKRETVEQFTRLIEQVKDQIKLEMNQAKEDSDSLKSKNLQIERALQYIESEQKIIMEEIQYG